MTIEAVDREIAEQTKNLNEQQKGVVLGFIYGLAADVNRSDGSKKKADSGEA